MSMIGNLSTILANIDISNGLGELKDGLDDFNQTLEQINRVINENDPIIVSAFQQIYYASKNSLQRILNKIQLNELLYNIYGKEITSVIAIPMALKGDDDLNEILQHWNNINKNLDKFYSILDIPEKDQLVLGGQSFYDDPTMIILGIAIIVLVFTIIYKLNNKKKKRNN